MYKIYQKIDFNDFGIINMRYNVHESNVIVKANIQDNLEGRNDDKYFKENSLTEKEY